MAHSFVQAHDDEDEAFFHFARSRPDGLVMLIEALDLARAQRGRLRLVDIPEELLDLARRAGEARAGKLSTDAEVDQTPFPRRAGSSCRTAD